MQLSQSVMMSEAKNPYKSHGPWCPEEPPRRKCNVTPELMTFLRHWLRNRIHVDKKYRDNLNRHGVD
jgi:hypothetical protein